MVNTAIKITIAAVMLFLFINDSPISKKIWLLVTAAVSAVSMIYIAVVYQQFGKNLQKISTEYIDRAKWQLDFNTYMICIVALLLIVSAVFAYTYSNIKKHGSKDNPDSFEEYIVIGTALIIAIAVYFAGTSFALAHMSKYFDVSFYPVAVSSSVISLIVVNILLYMKYCNKNSGSSYELPPYFC